MKTVECVFCGAAADTREHIIPKWMHRRFAIEHERLRLRNATEIQYVYEVVPACRSCNSERFSQLEAKVIAGTATRQDLYTWAAKIYWGLNLKDSALPESRKDASKGQILTREEAVAGVKFLAMILAHYGEPGFTVFPNPFGSVFEISLPEEIVPGFALCSIGYPYSVITISTSETNLLTVLLNDKGLVKRALDEKLLPDHKQVDLAMELTQLPPGAVLTANTYAKLLTLHYCRQKCRLSIPKTVLCSAHRVASLRVPKKLTISTANDKAVMADVLSKLVIPDLA